MIHSGSVVEVSVTFFLAWISAVCNEVKGIVWLTLSPDHCQLNETSQFVEAAKWARGGSHARQVKKESSQLVQADEKY